MYSNLIHFIFPAKLKITVTCLKGDIGGLDLILQEFLLVHKKRFKT